MPRFRVRQICLTAALLLSSGAGAVFGAPPSGATTGGGTNGSGIWAATWWNGNPQGPGPYIPGQYNSAAVCNWTDVGSKPADLAAALATAGLPAEFWGSGYGAPAVVMMRWAASAERGSPAGSHFDVVACPSAGMVPSSSSGYMYTGLPAVGTPNGPVYIWVFFDTVPNPGSGPLPPIIGEAIQRAQLPSPQLNTSPKSIGAINDAGVVNFPNWFWIDPAAWRMIVASAAGGGLVATVWATPQSVTWRSAWDFSSASSDPEHGVDLTPTTLDLVCSGPGTPYSPALAALAGGSSPDCGATFTQSTFGDWVPLRASITWTVYWMLTDTSGVVGGEGELPAIVTTGTRPLRVLQVESVVNWL